MSTVKIPPVLRGSSAAPRRSRPTAATWARCCARSPHEHPATESQLFAEDGELNRYVNVYLNDEDVRVLDGLETAVGPRTPS